MNALVQIHDRLYSNNINGLTSVCTFLWRDMYLTLLKGVFSVGAVYPSGVNLYFLPRGKSSGARAFAFTGSSVPWHCTFFVEINPREGKERLVREGLFIAAVKRVIKPTNLLVDVKCNWNIECKYSRMQWLPGLHDLIMCGNREETHGKCHWWNEC